MDSNNMYPNGQAGGADPNNGQTTNYGDNAYQNNQTMNYAENGYQDNGGYNQNPNYQPYQYNNNSYSNPYPQTDLEEPVKVGEWLISMLILLIPCVNLIMMFVWAFSKSEKKSKSNYFKACLIWAAIVMAIYLVIVIALVAMGIGLSSAYY
ncbi:MAG: hypothetical protein NC318_00900 [Blautia sp.]|nr:hypothetical protein [Lachnoclostridium sp.]MCM1210144.1 hypothetical protein [Blautia sp.]